MARSLSGPGRRAALAGMGMLLGVRLDGASSLPAAVPDARLDRQTSK
jgi:hypothetical protein